MPIIDPRSGPSYGTMEQDTDVEREQLLRDDCEEEGQPSGISTPDEMQEGVQKIEAINLTWTHKSLIVAYVRFVWLAVPCCYLDPPADLAPKHIPHGLLHLIGGSDCHVTVGICDECIQ